jgi:hypothetical protein
MPRTQVRDWEVWVMLWDTVDGVEHLRGLDEHKGEILGFFRPLRFRNRRLGSIVAQTARALRTPGFSPHFHPLLVVGTFAVESVF